MRELYPGMQPSLAELERNVAKYAEAKTFSATEHDKGNLGLHNLWFDYARFFDAAPYTDNTTPAPPRIEPNVPDKIGNPALGAVKGLWDAAADAAAKAAGKAAGAIGEKLDEYVLIGLGIAGALGALWVIVNRKRT
jgi:hypothetical protein